MAWGCVTKWSFNPPPPCLADRLTGLGLPNAHHATEYKIAACTKIKLTFPTALYAQAAVV